MARKKKISEEKPIEELPIMPIIGWENSEEVAETIWKSNADLLLRGNLVFAFKGDTPGKGPMTLIVVRNFYRDVDGKTPIYTDWGLYYSTSTISSIIPHTSLDYLKTISYNDLEDAKVDPIVLKSYINQIKLYEEENGDK